MMITLVSGLAGEIRRLKGLELRQVSDPANVRGGGSVELLLKNCFLSVTDPGPYPALEVGAKPNWDKVLNGDRFDALLQLRAASFGPDYEFPFQCSKCKERTDWEVAFAEFPRTLLKPEAAAKIRAGENAFEDVTPDGRGFRFKLLMGEDEKRGSSLRRKQRNAWSHHDAIMLHLLGIDGVGELPHDERKVRAYLDDLDWGSCVEMLERIQEHECGVETAIEVRCDFCAWEQEIQMPFEAGFFSPPKKKPASEDEKGKTSKSSTSTPTTSGPPASGATSAPAATPSSGAGSSTTSSSTGSTGALV